MQSKSKGLNKNAQKYSEHSVYIIACKCLLSILQTVGAACPIRLNNVLEIEGLFSYVPCRCSVQDVSHS